jgi:DNA-binding winged helix-turn-helix (wHTH) protein/Tol biopolymer transport system component
VTSLQPRSAETRDRQYRFGDFTLDLDGGFLRRGADAVPLRPKAFDALTYLVARHGRLVTKTELLEAIWPDAAVTDNSLAQCLAEIRRALGDDSQQAIRTVARRGYVFAAPVSTASVKFTRVSGDAVEGLPASLGVARPTPESRRWKTAGVLVVCAAVAGGLFSLRVASRSGRGLTYTQLTDFTDSAVAPAVSPDGRMLAFIRGEKWFGGTDQIYLKMLPNGEAVRLTNDPLQKYGVSFSPDGSRIAYTVWGDGHGFNTNTVSVLGGEPTRLLPNAAGLTWLDEHRLLFAETKTGQHMGIVTATSSRAEHHEVYFPQHQRAMAHYAYASPDRRWALVIEMDHRPVWQPCRLVPLDGRSTGRQVGPQGRCTSAGWSRDGTWMYFTVAVDETHHLWRQRFPDGEPEQMTFGPAEEDGVAVTPDGALVTSIGVERTAIWMHDRRGDRPLSSEGTVIYHIGAASLPSFAPDGRSVFYLRESAGSRRELWKTDVESGRSDPVLSGIAVAENDVSADGREVVFSTEPGGKASQLWLAPVDRSTPPVLLAAGGENAPRFGPDGRILFRFTENNFNHLGQMNRDGSGRSKAVPYPISTFMHTSPDRRWLMAIVPEFSAGKTAATMAVPTAGGSPHAICVYTCWGAWSPDGRFLYVSSDVRTRTNPGRTIAMPVARDTGLPDLPQGGITSLKHALSIPGSVVIEQDDVVPGPDPSTYAYVKTTAHRNLFRIHLR